MYSVGLASSLSRRAVKTVSQQDRWLVKELTLQELEHSVERENNSYTHEGTAAKHISELRGIM